MTTEKYDKKKAHTATHTHKNYNKITFCHIYNSWALNKIMKDQGSVYQRMHCPCIYYLILFQCDIFQITYNSHIHNITVDFRCPYTFMPQQLLDCRDIRSII
ncbi:hypothetical protein HMPREF1060_03980 [Parabacteroides merdae CL03T12C32]|uniref:Uncharacterized protein n=1 Tax=Parabacteroides merdae CL03T12C32 TaxID=999420 RepID=K5Z5R9_9BACT|nr:hypothetical protein HMPREF1060_03980 [Parabacteroides merdae CL03T12C32]